MAWDGVCEVPDLAARMQEALAGHENRRVTTRALQPADVAALPSSLALPADKALWVCVIEGFPPVPCGGTHVACVHDIGLIRITSCRIKKGQTKAFYNLDEC
ncbi:hypothetical protein [Candidatus Hepatobacter penaei]|uniref:hypothetical protein n=1 Tax=Candidatus Hepatobacter penaei TaxID=1274402 RepID=UPI0004F2844C|nr:hypothetical protein [Candidatus Hepatobacter penaei]